MAWCVPRPDFRTQVAEVSKRIPSWGTRGSPGEKTLSADWGPDQQDYENLLDGCFLLLV